MPKPPLAVMEWHRIDDGFLSHVKATDKVLLLSKDGSYLVGSVGDDPNMASGELVSLGFWVNGLFIKRRMFSHFMVIGPAEKYDPTAF